MEQKRNNIFTKSDEELIRILARWWKMSEDELLKPFKVIASFKKADKRDKNDREYGYFVDVRNLNGDILYYPPKFGPVKIFSLYKDGFMSSDIWQINVKLAPRSQRDKFKNPFLLIMDNAIVGKPKVQFLDKLKKEKLIRKIFEETGSTERDAKNTSNALHAIMGDLYTETERFVFELLQNADDQPEDGEMVNVKLKTLEENLLFLHTGKPFTENDVESISSIGDSTKKKDTEKTGYKGIGFKSVFSDADTVYIDSGNFSFAFDKNSPLYPEEANMDEIPWQIKPIWEEKYRLPKEVQKEDLYFLAPVGIALNVGSDKIKTYNDRISELLTKPQFTLFLRNVGEISFESKGRETITIRKQVTDSGIVQITSNSIIENWITKDYIIDIPVETKDAIQNEKLVPTKLKEATKTKITFAAKIEDGSVCPIKDAVLYTYLPTKVNDFGFMFLVNADFLTTASREQIHFKNIWNRFLFNQIGSLLLDWVKSLKDYKGALGLLPLRVDNTENLLANAFYSSLKVSLSESDFIVSHKGDLLSIKDIMLDKSGLSQIIGKDLFCQLVDNQKSLPMYEQDETALKNNELCPNITAITTLAVLPKLTNNSLFKRWFVESDETTKGIFYDWLLKKNTEQRKGSIVKLVSSLPIYKFGDNYLSKEEANESTNRIVIHNGHSALLPVYKACGIECSDNIDLLPISCFYSDSIIKSTFEYIFSHLRDNEAFSKWIHTASESDKKILEDWLDKQDTNAERHKVLVNFVESLPIVVFKDKIYKRSELIKRVKKSVTTGYNRVSIVEVDELDSTRLIISNKLFPIVDLLTKIGFVCSANIQNTSLIKFFNLPKEYDLFNLINTKAGDALKDNGNLLTPAEKLSLFNVLKELDGVNETNISQNLLFENQAHTHRRWLSTMTNYSSDIPTWIYEYTICEQENFPELESYLIKKDRVFEEIIKKHIEEIITEVTPKEIYLHYKDQWSSDFTKTLITKYGATSAILEMIELQDKDSQKFFLQKVEKIELKTGDVCPLDSYEIKVLKLAFNSYDDNEIRLFAEKLLFNGKAVSKVTYSDDVNLQYHENCILKLSLSDLLPEYKDSGMIQQVRCCLSNLGESNLNRLFTLVPMDISEINNKLDVSNGYTQTKYLFRLFYTRKYRGWNNNAVVNIDLSAASTEWTHKLLDILFSQRVKLYQDSFGYRLSSYFSGYISSPYIMDSEKIPSYVENWADSEEKRAYLYEQGIGTEKKELIKFRKKIVNDEIVSETEVQEQSNSIISTLSYLIEKVALPLSGNNQKETLLKISSICRNVTSQIDIDKLKDISEEYNLAEYLNWKSESTIKIYVFSGMIPKKLIYLNNILCLYSQEHSYYDWAQKTLYISKDVEVRDVLYNAISNNSIPFTSSDWSKLYYDNLVSKEEVESRDMEIENLKRELQEYIDKFGKLSKEKDVSKPHSSNPDDKDNSEAKKKQEHDREEDSDKTKDKDPTIERGKGQEIPKSKQIAAQLEAQQFLMKEMPEWHYPPHYGEYNIEDGIPYYYSTVMLHDSLWESILIVLKSYKNQDEPFKINPTEWESIIKDSAYLLIYTGDDIKRITKEDLVKNQSNISLSFSTENLDIEDRISSFCSSLHYFKELHFDFKSFNLSESAESIKNIFKKNEGTQNGNTEEDL